MRGRQEFPTWPWLPRRPPRWFYVIAVAGALSGIAGGVVEAIRGNGLWGKAGSVVAIIGGTVALIILLAWRARGGRGSSNL